MIRRVAALALLLLLGLYLPAAGMPVCLCIGTAASMEESCCSEAGSCCEEPHSGCKSCCGDPECCVVISGIPDGMEPQAAQLPMPLVAPLPIILQEEFLVPNWTAVQPPLPLPRSLPPPGDPVRIAFGVWRL